MIVNDYIVSIVGTRHLALSTIDYIFPPTSDC